MTYESYLDFHSTTPVDPRVRDAMWPFFGEQFGNPASRSHSVGRDAAGAVAAAREQIARFIGARASEIVFTSCATESNNLALKGVVRSRGSSTRKQIITLVTEHPSVLDTCTALEREGFAVARLAVGQDGLIDLDDLRRALQTPTTLVSIMTANNEIGVLQPIPEIARIVHAAGALLHTDASQAAGRIPLEAKALGADLMSFTAHKMYGPKGIAALYVEAGIGRLEAILHGGGQEGGLRPGTLNVPAIVGFGVAATLAMEEGGAEASRVALLRDQLLFELREGISDLRVNGSMTARLPHNLNVSLPGVEANSLAVALDDLAISSGSACFSGSGVPSYVLAALGLPDELARASIRFGLGRWTTSATIRNAVERVIRAVIESRESRSRGGAVNGGRIDRAPEAMSTIPRSRPASKQHR